MLIEVGLECVRFVAGCVGIIGHRVPGTSGKNRRTVIPGRFPGRLKHQILDGDENLVFQAVWRRWLLWRG